MASCSRDLFGWYIHLSLSLLAHSFLSYGMISFSLSSILHKIFCHWIFSYGSNLWSFLSSIDFDFGINPLQLYIVHMLFCFCFINDHDVMYLIFTSANKTTHCIFLFISMSYFQMFGCDYRCKPSWPGQ